MATVSSSPQSVAVYSKITVTTDAGGKEYYRTSKTGKGSVTCSVSVPAGSTVTGSSFSCTTSGGTLYGGTTKINGVTVTGTGPHTVANGTALSITVPLSFKSTANDGGPTSNPKSNYTAIRTFSDCILTVTYTPPTAATVTTPTVSSQYVSGGNVTVGFTGTNGTNNAITSYNLYRSTNNGSWVSAGSLTAGSGTRSIALAAASAGSYCKYAVVAVAPYGNSAQSAASPIVYTYTAPTLSGVRLAASTSSQYALGGATVALSWTADNGTYNNISSFKIQRSDNGGAYADLSGATALGTAVRSHNVTAKTTAGHYYQYRIIAYGANSNTAWVESPKLYTYSLPTVTSVRVNGSASTQYLKSGASTTIAWTGTNGSFNSITSYTIQRKINGGAWTNLATGLTTSPQTITASITPNDYYTYQIIAVAPRGNSAWATSPSLYTYSLPSITAALISGSSSDQYRAASTPTIALSWTKNDGAQNAVTGYIIEVSDNGGAFTPITGSPFSAATLTTNITSNATAGEYNQYRITPTAARGNGSVVSFPRLYSYSNPTAPTSVSISASVVSPGDSVTISWSGATEGVGVGITKYEVYVGASTKLGESTTSSYTFTAGAAGSYIYKIKSIGSVSGHNSGYSSTVALEVKLPSSTFTLSGLTNNEILMNNSAVATATVTPAGSGLTHTIKWYIPNTALTINATVSSTTNVHTTTFPLAWAAAFPNSNKGTIACRVTTSRGAETLGFSELFFTGIVPSTVKPTVTLPVSPVEGWGAYYLKNISKCLLDPIFTSAHGSTFVSWSFSGGGYNGTGSTEGATWTTGALGTVGSNTMSVTVTDSRGHTQTATQNITVSDYSLPTLTNISVLRCNSAGTFVDNGTYIKAKITAVAASVGANTIATLNFKYKKTTVPTWSDAVTLTSGAYSAVQGAGLIDIAFAYDILFTATDSTGRTQTGSFIVSASKFLFEIKEDRASFGALAPNAQELHIPSDWKFAVGTNEVLHMGNYSTVVASKAHTHTAAEVGAAESSHSHSYLPLTGNAASATKLATARTLTIGDTGKTFNGSADVSWSLAEIGAAASSHTHSYAPLTGAGTSGTWGISITGNAATLTTARTLTIGSTGKTFNGSANVSWTLAEIGAAASSHDHIQLYARTDNRSVATAPNDYNNYFTVAGLKNSSAVGTPMTGTYVGIIGWRQWSDSSGGPATELAFGDEGIAFRQGATTSWGGWNRLIHSGNYNSYITPANIGAAASSHGHATLSLSGSDAIIIPGGGGAGTHGAPAGRYPVAAYENHGWTFTVQETANGKFKVVRANRSDELLTVYETGRVTVNSTSITAGTRSLRNISAGTGGASGGSNGDIYIKYT